MNNKQYSELLLDQIKDLVWAVDSDLLLVYANKSYLNLMKEVMGVEKELNTPILVEGFGEGYIEKWKAYYLRALSGEGFEIEEHFYNPETQEMQYGHIAFSPIREEGGKILTVACRSTDITPVIKQKVHASKLMDASLDVFCTIDEAGDFVYVNAVSADHWGYHPEELIGKPFRDLVVAEDLEKTDQVAAEIMAGREFKSFSNRYRKKNGDTAYNSWSVRWDNESKLMYCVARDAKEKIEEERHLKLLEKVINSTSDAIIITEAEPLDEPGPRIVYVNEAFTKSTGYTAEEVIGKNPRILQGPDSNQEELRKLGDKLRRWEAAEITVLNYTKNGEPFWINFAVSPVANEKGWFTHWISVQRDVTEQKKQEAVKDLLSQISQSFNSEEGLIPSANRLCENLYAYGKFDLIEVWCLNMEQTKINLIGKSDHNQDFYEIEASETSFQKNEGLPGKVWNKGKQLLWDEKQINKNFVRKNGASQLGLKGILGIPLTFSNQIEGVLLIGTKREPEYLEQHLQVLSHLEKFIGSEINRKRLENDFRHLYQAIPDILCIADFTGRFLKINPAGCELLGYKEVEILFHSFDEFVHPEDKDVATRELRKHENGASTFHFENRYITKEGKIIWLSWSCNSSVEEGLIYASAKDITAMVQLRELNAQAGALAKIGSWEIDLEKNTLFWSKMVHELHETDPDSFIPVLETAINFYREDFRPLVQSSIEKSITTGDAFDFEAVIITTKLQERWVRAIGNVEIVNDKATRIYGSFQDITDRKEAEVRLQSLSDDLPGVTFQFRVSPEGKDSRHLTSKAAYKIWGISPEESEQNVDIVWNQIKNGGDFEKVQESIGKSMSTGEKWNCQWRNLLPSGELRWHEGYGTPNYLPDGTIVFNSMIFDITDEKKAVLLYEETAKTARLGTWEIDLISQKVYLSEVTREIHELDEETEISLEDGLNFYKENYRDVARKALQDLVENGIPMEFELPILTVNKNERWVRVIGQAEVSEGKPVRLFGSIQDIHERKQSQLELLKAKELAEENEHQMKQAQKLAHLGSWHYDVVNQVSQWSEETYNIWGLNKDITSINLVDHQKLVHPKDWERFNAVIKNAIEKGIPYKMDLELVHSDGSHKTVNTIGEPIFDENNKVIAFKGTTQDISDRILYENELRSAKEKAEKSLKSLEDYKYALVQSAIIAFTDNKGIITSVNDNFCKISKYEREEIIGKTHRLINSKYHPKEFFNDLWKTIASGKVWRGEIKNISKDGTYYWVDTTIVPFLDELKNPIQYLAIRFDITERKKAEQEKTSLQETIENSLNEIYTFDTKTYLFSYVNQGALLNLGYSEQEIQSLTPLDLKPDFTQISFNQLVAPLRSNEKEKIIFFTNHKRKDGSLYPVEVHLQLISDGNTKRFLAIVLDITERKKAEKKLLNALQEKNNILESIGDAFFAVDKDWTITYWNKQSEIIMGKNKESVLGKNLWELYSDAIDSDFYRQYHRAMETGETVNFEEFYPTLDIWIEVTVYPSENGLSIYFKDITLRKKVDIRLLEANERFEKVTEATNDAIWDWDIQNNTQYWGKGFKKLFGYELEGVSTSVSSWMERIHKEDRDKVTQSLDKTLESNIDNWVSEYRYLKADGTYAEVIDRGITIRNTNGKPIRMIGAMTDITQQKAQEKHLLSLNESLKNYAKELERSNEELEQFAFITSHDLQEPLRMITSFMDQLKRKYEDQLDDKALQYIHYATDGARRMKQIILDLLLYSRANKPSEQLEEVNLNELVSEYMQLRRKLIAEKRVVISFDPLPVLPSYKAPLTQIFHSLLDNALKYVKENVPPRIEILTQEKETVWEFAIKDNGIGIDEQFYDKIFIIFQRLHNRDQHDGTGIGLSIAKRSVEFLGGEIWLDSTEGEGSTFYFTVKKST